ncbi:putative bifunctional diguanylate cyclase/phosphodiesterase [Paenibacillus harenae]|uniref:putative bifunctional diguanylate cyclase/phosphodiesterase n=1 Tax=Paenibacillus harenae TaxID=306543 RepID=UPI002794172A|nr:EAL domain-containing protein [Paenibacillus harenae]MDQ0062230.1 diguanylate cyclase (GGDEF)-like protein [Paenibacillus harenae]
MLQRRKDKSTHLYSSDSYGEKGKGGGDKRAFSPLLGSIRIAGVYFVVGCLWILLTDRAVSAVTNNAGWIAKINMIKGWFFIFVTALLVFALIWRTLKRIKKVEEKLELAYREMVQAHDELESAYEEITAAEDELRQQYDFVTQNQRKLRESEEKMQHLAYHDLLTGLPNKLGLYENVGNSFFAGREGHAALLFVDIDNFKYINDTMGHGFGDRLIVKASERLKSIVAQQGVVYRFGGDEFIIVWHSLAQREHIHEAAGSILSCFKQAVDMESTMIHISISVGISLYPDHGSDMMELVKRADIAMHKAKEAGKDNYIVFDHPLNEIFAERMMIEKQLYKALELNEFELAYQPQIDLATNRISGLEALLRWKSPELGCVSPLKFIKVAEDTHQIVPLGEWVLGKACRFLRELHQKGFGHLTMSVNISVLQLLQTGFNEMVLSTLQASGLDPQDLELEITESVLLESYDHVSLKLNELKRTNIKIALDDFGTGYSSLSHLTHLPISTLKIDKSFIDLIGAESNHQATLVEQIILIGKRMSMNVIAEGVESADQLAYLREQGCDKVQGYFFSRPLAAGELEQLLLG